MRDSILIYRSQIDALRNLPAEQFKAALLAIAAYGMDGVEPEGDPVVVAMVGMAKPLIDKNNRNFKNGIRGGRPQKPEEEEKNRGLLDEKPIDNRNAESNNRNAESNNRNAEINNRNAEINNRIDESHNPKEKGERRKEKDLKENTPNGVQKKSVERFSPPTQDQVQEYVSANGYNVDASRFVDYYKSKGWMVGKTKMKDWKAAVRNWSRSEGQRQELTAKGNTTTTNRFNNFPAREYDYDELERQLLSAQTRGAS